MAMLVAALVAAPAQAAPLPGAIFTTDSTCSGVDLNIYASKDAVYIDGGPAHPGAASLPDGSYYVQVTDPSGATVLGTSVGTGTEKPFVVSGGEPAACYQLSSIVANSGVPGYLDTPNAGGEYKVWVSTDPTFTNDSTKTDNFKVKESETPPDTATLRVRKYYDANVSGTYDAGDTLLTGWKFRIQDGFDQFRETPVDMVVAPDTYTATEQAPLQTNWLNTDPGNPIAAAGGQSKVTTLGSGDDTTLYFGNVCLGAGGGLTLGFWSNKNGQALETASDLAALTALHLRNANGSDFDPATAAALSKWLLAANATNMANMLSAQLAAMVLNVRHGFVSPTALVWNGTAFVSIGSVMADADASLAANGYTVAASAVRTSQERLKNTLDKANNNLNFVQASACAFTFGS